MMYEFLNRPRFSFRELVRLTALKPTLIHGYIQRGLFKPQFKQRAGRPSGPSYTGKDVLRLHLIAAATEFGIYRNAPLLAALLRRLDGAIAHFASGTPANTAPEIVTLPTQGAGVAIREPWINLSLDLSALVSVECRKLTEYLEAITGN